MKTEAFNFFNKQYTVDSYTELYKKIKFNLRYPANVKRLQIIIGLLEKHKPKKVIDAGCGAGMPLIEIKKRGFNIYGYDKAKNMVLEAKDNLANNRLSTDLIFYDNFENPKKIKNNSVDCILGMGTFFYAKNFKKTILNQKNKLKKNGRLIFSLRNKLFDISTLNNYTKKILDEIYEIKYLKNDTWKRKYKNLTKGFADRKKHKFKNIDEEGVLSLVHNPLSIASEMLELGLKCEGIYFYHFHSLPPLFENFDKLYFRKISWKMENPTDWRGFLLASGFIVDCKKL
jgi:SAM-dependent methyltransferase